ESATESQTIALTKLDLRSSSRLRWYDRQSFSPKWGFCVNKIRNCCGVSRMASTAVSASTERGAGPPLTSSLPPFKWPASKRIHTTRFPGEISTDRILPEVITKQLYG